MVTLRRQIGNLGEKIALDYLKKQGYQILERNYQKPWGEIDLIAQNKSQEIIFIEVKTKAVSQEKAEQKSKDHFLPEENVNWSKRKKLLRIAQTYLLEKRYSSETSWQIDVIAVELNLRQRKARLAHFKNAFWQ